MKRILYFVAAIAIVAVSCTIKKAEPTCETVDAVELIDSVSSDSVDVDTIEVNDGVLL